MELLSTYIPMDRRQAMARGQDLPDRTNGAALFADISGFTPLTEALVTELDPKRGAEELSRLLNSIYGALVLKVHRYRGSVIGFSGDAITCWFDGDDGLRAVACSLDMQRTMSDSQLAEVKIPSGKTFSLGMKVAVATGPVRRFMVGDPEIQIVDVLAGATLDRLAATEKHATRGEVVVEEECLKQLGGRLHVVQERQEAESSQESPLPVKGALGVGGRRFAVVTWPEQQRPVKPTPWPPLAADRLTEAQLRPWLLRPVYERLVTGQEKFLAEIRPAVALFLRFGGIDYDVVVPNADEDAPQKLDRYIRWVQNVLAHYEGHVLQLTMGDKGSFLYSAFGAPIAHADDPARAVAAALELVVPPPEMNFIRGVQIGLSQGRMWAGAYGGAARHTYGVLGDHVNLAARLMSKAEMGQILVSQDVMEATSQSYQFKSIGLAQIKGKKDPLPLFAVEHKQRPSQPQPVATFSKPLVGRLAELAQMEQVLESVLSGEGHVLQLEGEPGVGKSHLAAEFVARAMRRGLRVASGTCQGLGRDMAYSPWRQILRTLLVLANGANQDPAVSTASQIAQVEAAVSQANAGLLIRLPLLGDLLGLPIPENVATAAFDPRLRQEALFSLAIELIQAWTCAQPLLLLIEDVHGMDEASAKLTLALGRAMARTPALLVLVHRPLALEGNPLLPDLDRLPYHHRLTLGDLSPEGSARLVADRLSGQPSTLALTLIWDKAQGNPFFIEELVDTLRETGKLQRQANGVWTLSEGMVQTLQAAHCLVRSEDPSGEGWTLASNTRLSDVEVDIPTSIQSLVLGRIDRLPEMHKPTLKVSSVIGRIFELDVLTGAHPARPEPDQLLGQVKLLETRDFVLPETPSASPSLTYLFKHQITQEVAYATLLEAQQREFHRAVGAALERLYPAAVEQLAYHYSRAGVRDKMLYYLDKAARQAQRKYANEIALDYYTQAVALEERWEWRQGQVEVLHILGRREAERAALQALKANPDAPTFEVNYSWGLYHEAVGEYPQAEDAIERALGACQARGDRVNEVRCLAHLGLIARRQGDYETAKTWYGQALTLFPEDAACSPEEAEALAQAMNGLGIVYRQQGNFDGAKACYERALALSRQSGNRKSEADALNHLGVTAYCQRNFAGALAHYRQALDIRQAIGNRAGEGESLLSLAQVNVLVGDYDEAEKFFSSALATQQAIGNRWEEVNVWNGLGVLYLELGDLTRAQHCLQSGLKLSQEIGDEAGEAYMLSNLGLAARDSQDLEAAEKLLTEGLTLAQAQDDKNLVSVFHSYLSSVSLLAGRPDQAIEQANAALTARQELGLRLMAADDLATLAIAHLNSGDMAKALGYAHQSLTILNECGGEGPEFPGRDYFACYQVLRANGQTKAAHDALQLAYKLVMARAEKITDPILRQSFLECAPINRQIVQEVASQDIMCDAL